MPEVIPYQTTYVSPFAEDTPSSISKVLSPYNLFVKQGDYSYHGYNTRRFTTITDTIPNVSARVYDTDGTEFVATWDNAFSFNVTGGKIVVNNILIELEDFTTNFNESDSHWKSSGYGLWTFANSSTSYATMCVLFDPYNNGVVDENMPLAGIVYTLPDEVNFSIMAPICHVRIVKSGSTVTSATTLLEHSSISDYPIEQIGFWKNFVIDGGDLG